MPWAELLVKEFKATGTRFIVTLPDSWLAEVIRLVERDPELCHVPVAREEEGVGICCGASLAGKRAALLVQNAGILSSGGALTNLALSYGIPFLLLVADRGRADDALPHHVPKARATRSMLGALGLPCRELMTPLAGALKAAWEEVEREGKPLALLITKKVVDSPDG
ncbi:MAG: sulfopyruvate decarboxylase subunit alpha [Nitrospinota bacterium]